MHLSKESEDGSTGDGEDGDAHLGTSTLELWGLWDGWNDWDGGVGWDLWNTGSSGDWVGGDNRGSLNWSLWLLLNWGLDWSSSGGWSWGGGNWSWGLDWDVGGGVSWASWLLWWAGSDGHNLGLVDDNVWVGNGIDTEDNGGDSGDGRETHFDVCCFFFRVEKIKRSF